MDAQSAASLATFVGRGAEMEVLRRALDDTGAGRGRCVFLSGEAGIGKTRTAEELATYAQSRGAQVLWGRCYEGEGAPAFWPWVQILRVCVSSLDPDARTALLDATSPELARLVPTLRQDTRDPSGAAAPEAPEARFRLFDGVAGVLGERAQHRPLLLVLDDLHAADRPSLLLLEFLAQHVRDIRLLILGTYRDAGVSGTHPLHHTMVELGRAVGTERLALTGWSAAEVGRFIEAQTGLQPSAAFVRELHARTEGNPLFVGEYARLMAQRAAAVPPPVATAMLPVPHSVQAVIARRLAPLSEGTRAVLRIAAVIGREFSLAVLSAVLATGELSAVNAANVVEEAEAASIVSPIVGAPERYRFAHALIPETLYGALRQSERAQLHRHVGEAIERSVEAEQPLAELAYHFFAAGGEEDIDKAVAYAHQAGHRAATMLAYEEALRLYQAALAGLDRMPTSDDATRCTILVDLGIAQNAAGDLEKSKSTLAQAAALAQRLGLREELGRAALHYGSKYAFGEQPAPDDEWIRLLETAVTAWAETESVTHAALLARLAVALRFSDQHARRSAVGERALQMARSIAAPTGIAYALHAWHVSQWEPDNLDRRVAAATELVQIAEQIQDFELGFDGQAWCFDNHLELGNREAMDADFAVCERLSKRLGQPHYRWYTRNARVTLLTLEGQFGQAEELAQENLSFGQTVSNGAPMVLAVQMFVLSCAQGRREVLEGSAAAFGALASQFPAMPLYRCTAAYLAGELGRADQARLEFESLAAKQFADIRRDQVWFIFMRQLAEVCARLGDAKQAARLATLLAPYEDRAITVLTCGGYLGPVSHCLGLLETTLERWDDATRQFEHALAMNRRMRAWPWLARTRYEYARMLLARRQADDQHRASALLDAARATARELGMPMLLERVESCSLPGADGSVDDVRQSAIRSAGPAMEAVFRCEGDYWTIAYDGRVLRMRDTKGLQYLAHLLRNPGRELLAVDLVAGVAGQRSLGDQDGVALHREHSAAAEPDARARTQYRQRIMELRDDLAEAERNNDLGRTERAREEMELITQQLAVASGLGGRRRVGGEAAERARQTVTKGIKAAIQKIRQSNPALARHLARAVTTGYYCAYSPDPEQIVAWML